jgi:membrane dipeptidase
LYFYPFYLFQQKLAIPLKNLLYVLLSFLFLACQRPTSKLSFSDQQLRQKADEIAHKYVIIDGHVDLPYRLKIKNFQLERAYQNIPVSSKEGDFDYERAQKGGLSGPMMSIYIPSSHDKDGQAKALADSLIHMVQWIAKSSSQYFELAKSPAEILAIKAKGKIALPMGMENGSPLQNLADVAYFRQQGISYVTLTHAKDNHICDSSYDTTATWQGLSPFGYSLLPELARQGIMIDVSHISDSSFYDVIAASPVPVIASHSSARHFTPSFQRNMSDSMISIMGKKDGVIMVNFGSTFLDATVAATRRANDAKLTKLLKDKGLSESSLAAAPIVEGFKKENPSVYADVEMVANHIDHIVKLAGINAVGFGSDFDGVGDSLPTGLKDVADYPNLLYVLLKRGYSEADLAKMCSGNIFRVWNKTLAFAAANK